MALSSKERQESLRKRRTKLGLKRRELSLTDEDFEKVKIFIKNLDKNKSI